MKKRYVLILATLFSLLFSAVVLAEDSNPALEPRQEITKNVQTGEITVNDTPTLFRDSDSGYTDGFIPENVAPKGKAIIGSDNRTRVTNTTTYPNSAIAYIEIKFPNDTDLYGGTAWMYGNRVAVTAGHCVYDASLGGWAEWVRVLPGSNGGTAPFGTYYASFLHTDTKYVASEDSNYDWGLLEFNDNVGNQTGYFGASWTSSSMVGIGITVRGYPVSKAAQMWTMSGSIAASGRYKLSYYLDTTGGQSGSPVYRSEDGTIRGVGIHTNYSSLGYNQAERIDESLFNIMNQYR